MSSIIAVYLLAFCQSVITLVFITSFVMKAKNFAAFNQVIRELGIVPTSLSTLSGLLVLTGELVIVLLMTIGQEFIEVGFFLANLLLSIFCITLISVLARGINTTCNCFGSSKRIITFYDVWRNVGFVGCAVAGWLTHSTVAGRNVHLSLVEWGLVGLIAAMFVIVTTQVGEIAQFIRHNA